jgi:hypothetical protein
MNKRTEFRHVLALLMLFTGCNALAQAAGSLYSSPTGVAQVQGLVSAFDPHLGVATVGDVPIYVGNVIVELGLTLNIGDDIAVVGNFVDSAGFLFAVSVEFVLQRSPKALSAAKKESITGTGKQSSASLSKASITGTGISLQSITGTGRQSITGTGISSQSITGTGISTLSITGTGISSQSITGTGIRTLSITGTGALE